MMVKEMFFLQQGLKVLFLAASAVLISATTAATTATSTAKTAFSLPRAAPHGREELCLGKQTAMRTQAARRAPIGPSLTKPPRLSGCRTKKITSSSSRTTTMTGTALFMGLTLYGHPGTRSPLINWACYELGIDFDIAQDLSRNPHPFGQLPCLVDDGDKGDDVVVFESGAILQYILQYYLSNKQQGDKSKLLTMKQIGLITSWITWANASLDPICFLETPDGKVYDTGLKNPSNRRLLQLDSILSGQKYLVQHDGDGDGDSSSVFTIADVAVSSYLLYVVQFFPNLNTLASNYPNITRYMIDCVNRPSYGQAFGERTQSSLKANLLEQQKVSGSDGGGSGKKKLFGMF